MVLILALLLQQPPTLTPGASEAVLDRPRLALGISQSGKYLVLAEPDVLEIRDGTTLELVKELMGRWTAFGFDERDERFLVVGPKVRRYLTRDWSLPFEGELENAKFVEMKNPRPDPLDGKSPLKPGQALVLPDLDFYFVNKTGGISLAGIADGKLEMKAESLTADEKLQGISGMGAGVLFLTARGGGSRIALRGKVYGLVGCNNPILTAAIPGAAVVVGTDAEAVYTPSSWKVFGARSGQTNTCATVDAKSGWVLVGDRDGLRGWRVTDFNKSEVRILATKSPLLQVLAASESRALYTLEKTSLRRWTISD